MVEKNKTRTLICSRNFVDISAPSLALSTLMWKRSFSSNLYDPDV